MTSFSVRRRFGGIEILRLAFRLERPAAKRDRFALCVEHGKYQPSTEAIVRASFFLFHHEAAAFELLLRRAFLSEMRGKRFPTVGRKSKTKSGCRLFREAALLQVLTNGRGTFALQLILPPLQRPLIQLDDLI